MPYICKVVENLHMLWMGTWTCPHSFPPLFALVIICAKLVRHNLRDKLRTALRIHDAQYCARNNLRNKLWTIYNFMTQNIARLGIPSVERRTLFLDGYLVSPPYKLVNYGQYQFQSALPYFV